MPDAVNIFLCHSGQDPLVKQLLDFVRERCMRCRRSVVASSVRFP